MAAQKLGEVVAKALLREVVTASVPALPVSEPDHTPACARRADMSVGDVAVALVEPDAKGLKLLCEIVDSAPVTAPVRPLQALAYRHDLPGVPGRALHDAIDRAAVVDGNVWPQGEDDPGMLPHLKGARHQLTRTLRSARPPLSRGKAQKRNATGHSTALDWHPAPSGVRTALSRIPRPLRPGRSEAPRAFSPAWRPGSP